MSVRADIIHFGVFETRKKTRVQKRQLIPPLLQLKADELNQFLSKCVV